MTFVPMLPLLLLPRKVLQSHERLHQ